MVFIKAGVFPCQRIVFDLVLSVTDGVVYCNRDNCGSILSVGVLVVWSLSGFIVHLL